MGNPSNRGDYTLDENGQWLLPPGEIYFQQAFQQKSGSLMHYMVYLKHLELDDCPFLLAVFALLSEQGIDETLFRKQMASIDSVIAELASEFVYYAPMRRQTKYHPLDAR